MQYNVLEARNQLSKLIDAAISGEEVVIAKRGKPIARIVGVDEARVIGSPSMIAEWLAANPLPVAGGRTAAEIDAYIERERQAWD
jgi:prevent-host-death family protein